MHVIGCCIKISYSSISKQLFCTSTSISQWERPGMPVDHLPIALYFQKTKVPLAEHLPQANSVWRTVK